MKKTSARFEKGESGKTPSSGPDRCAGVNLCRNSSLAGPILIEWKGNYIPPST